MYPLEEKVCEICGERYRRNPKFPPAQWAASRFCSVQCKGVFSKGRSIKRPDEDTLRDLYEFWRLTTHQIGNKFGVPHISVCRWMKYYGIELRAGGRGLRTRGLEPPSREDLDRLIHVERRPYEEVAAIYKCDLTAIPYWLKKFGLPPSHKAGMYGSRHACKDGQLVRSSYERRVGDWLIGHSIPYRYEPTLPFCGYRADFLANGWYIEIWGMEKLESYKERRAEKCRLYHAHGLPLIELRPGNFGERIAIFNKRMKLCLKPAPAMLL